MKESTRWILVSTALLAACSLHDSKTASTSVVVCNGAAQAAFDAGQLEQARQGFAAGLAEARRKQSLRRQVGCAFYLGLVAQTEARLRPDRSQRLGLLSQAANWYESARPEGSLAPGLIANLARVYTDLGDQGRAEALFESALARSGGGRRATLARAYAQLLGPDRWARSVELYRAVLAIVPNDDESRDALFSLLGANTPAKLPSAVWDAVEAGRVLHAQRAALDALAKGAPTDPARVDLLAGLIAALARQRYDSRGFAASEAGTALLRLEADPLLGDGAREVLLAHSASKLDAQSFRWWDRSGTPYRRSPLFAFRSLLRSLAVRVDHGDPQVTRRYLRAAEDLGPATPDTQLWIEEAGNDLATGDTDTLGQSLDRWERLLKVGAVNVGRDDLAEYRRTLGKVQDLVEAQRAPVPRGGGGGRLVYTSDGGCVLGGGGCSFVAMLRILVPSLPNPAARPPSGVSRLALIEVGCRGRHVQEVTSPLRFPAGSAGVRLARFVPSDLATFLPWFPRRPAAVAQPTPQEWKRVALDAQPAWLSSAAWSRGSDLYLADSLRRQLLRIGEDGALQDVVPRFIPAGDGGYLHVQSSPAGEVVAEDGAGKLSFDVGSALSVATNLAGRETSYGELMSVFQWALLGDREVLAVANLLGDDGKWRSAIVRLAMAGEQVDVVHWIGMQDPWSNLYRVGIPAVAAIGSVGYFLALEEDPIGLYEAPRGELPHRLATLPALRSGFRDELNRHMALDRTAGLFQLLEKGSLPAGLFSQGDALFLLERAVAAGADRASWQLVRLDPRSGQALFSIRVPSTAHHLTVVPGDSRWAFFEKGAVESFGRQSVPSMLLVSSSLLRGVNPTVPTGQEKLPRPLAVMVTN